MQKSVLKTLRASIYTLLVLIAFPNLLHGEEPHDFARWEQAIAAFEKQDRVRPPARNGVVFTGSSSIRMWDLKKSFPKFEFVNRGFGGSEIVDATHFAERTLLKHRPRTVVLYAGDNDIARGKTARRVAEDFRKFTVTVHASGPRTRILFLAIKPSLKRWNLADEMQRANDRIRKTCERDERLTFVDVWQPMLGDDNRPRPELFAKDGLHLNGAGYRLWTTILRPHLQEPPAGD